LSAFGTWSNISQRQDLLTIRYKSAFARDSFVFEMPGAAIVGSSSPGILCLILYPAKRPQKNTTDGQEEE
jgi:hypothetical protein